MNTRLISLIIALLGLGLVISACGAPRGGSSSGSNSDDDDDATPPGDDDDDAADDDDVADDDDATDPPPEGPELTDEVASNGTCEDGVASSYPDEEPNDGIEWIQNLGAPTDGLCIDGAIVCGNDGKAFTNDLDLYAFGVPEGVTADFLLSWEDAAGDMDFTLTDVNGEVLHEFEIGGSPETADGVALDPNNAYVVRIGCWEGSDTGYYMEVVW